MKWLDKLSERWQVTPSRAIIILIVFACTGFTVYFLKRPILNYFAPEDRTWLFSLAYWILIFPIYNLILLGYGFVFGQFNFFWEFEKRMFRRMAGRK